MLSKSYINQIKQYIRCWIYQKEIISEEDYNELIFIKEDISFMDCSGQYDDMEERSRHYADSEHNRKIKILKLKHKDRLKFINYPYILEQNFEIKEI